MTTYNSIETDIQTIVYNIINSNKVTACTVLDGMPDQLMKLQGFPYVLVHSPERGEEKMLTHKIRLIPLDLTIEIFARDKESIARTLAGEVLGRLQSNQATTFNSKVFKYKTSKTNLNIDYVENVKIFKITATVKYEVMVFD
jgi:hypothetical protein